MSGNAKHNRKAPPPLEVAHSLYGSAFSTTSREDVEEAMDDWSELSEEERSFALGHLLYLNLQAQAENGRLLRRAVHELEEINDVAQETADDYFAEDEDEPEGEEQDEEDDDGGSMGDRELEGEVGERTEVVDSTSGAGGLGEESSELTPTGNTDSTATAELADNSAGQIENVRSGTSERMPRRSSRRRRSAADRTPELPGASEAGTQDDGEGRDAT